MSDSLENDELERAEEERLRLISIAKDIISGKTMPLQGALQLWGAARYLELQDEDPFASVIAFAVSDTDDLPLDESFRKLCSESFLLKKDIQTEELQSLYREDVLSACHEILKRYDV